MASQMIIRIEPELKDKVSRAAKAEGKTTSEVVRSLIEGWCQECFALLIQVSVLRSRTSCTSQYPFVRGLEVAIPPPSACFTTSMGQESGSMLPKARAKRAWH